MSVHPLPLPPVPTETLGLRQKAPGGRRAGGISRAVEGELWGVTATHRCTDLRDSCGLWGSWGNPHRPCVSSPSRVGCGWALREWGEEGPRGRGGRAQGTGVLSLVECVWLGAGGRGLWLGEGLSLRPRSVPSEG